MTAQIGELDREDLVARAAEALARRCARRQEAFPAVSLAMSRADFDRVVLVSLSGESLAMYALVRERGTLQLRWRDPRKPR